MIYDTLKSGAGQPPRPKGVTERGAEGSPSRLGEIMSKSGQEDDSELIYCECCGVMFNGIIYLYCPVCNAIPSYLDILQEDEEEDEVYQ